MTKKILCIGNGAAGLDVRGNVYINRHTGSFIDELIRMNFRISYSEMATEYAPGESLSDFCLNEVGIKPSLIRSNSRLILLLDLLRLFSLIIKTDFIYIFYPGTLSKIVSVFCIFMGKDYGLYIRGEKYSKSRLGSLIIKKSKFISTVSPLFLNHLEGLNRSVALIRPMLDDRGATRFVREISFVSPSCWNFLYVGRIEADKGIYELMQVAELLMKKGVSINFKLIGTGPLDSYVKNHPLVLKYNVIKILSPIYDWKELSKEYMRADAFIFLSHHEGFPRVLYEAMLHSLPIFTTFVGGIPGRMIDGLNCTRMPIKDASVAANIIYELLLSHATVFERGRAGFTTVTEVLDSTLTHSSIMKSRLDALC
jgi:glycosyltransferase involved in cell wall biosynthesis